MHASSTGLSNRSYVVLYLLQEWLDKCYFDDSDCRDDDDDYEMMRSRIQINHGKLAVCGPRQVGRYRQSSHLQIGMMKIIMVVMMIIIIIVVAMMMIIMVVAMIMTMVMVTKNLILLMVIMTIANKVEGGRRIGAGRL